MQYSLEINRLRRFADRRPMRRLLFLVLALLSSSRIEASENPSECAGLQSAPTRHFRAGACSIDVSPRNLPVLVNGGFLRSQAMRVGDPLSAKALVLDDGVIQVAIVVVDSCMMPRELLDRAEALAQKRTGIPIERMLISATHTHSAPAAMGALGCPADANYTVQLPGWIAASLEGAAKNLEPARIGWNVVDDHAHTFCRRWIRRPDKLLDDPFGQRSVRANMHPGYQSPDVIGPAGPVDPALTVLSVQSKSGRPIAVVANYSMHYYGAEPVSADYFGRFARALAVRIGAQAVTPPFVGIMSQGTSGDLMWMDYGKPRQDQGTDAYAANVAMAAHRAYQLIRYHDWVPLAVAETSLTLSRRVPDRARLEWAKAVVDRMTADALKNGQTPAPSTLPEVYAQEAMFLHDEPRRELKLQAIQIGELGITAIPNEVFAITGLKIKAQSPFDTTINIELANGAEGYIPPPEQHTLGGYTTWPARTAGLEVQAEPKIVATVLRLLEQIAGKSRRALSTANGPYATAINTSRPMAYWRLDDIQAPIALDSTTNQRNARFEDGVAFYLPGVSFPGLSAGGSVNRAAHFAGGRLEAALDGIGENYTFELWFWNGIPADIRPVTGYILSFGTEENNNTSAIRLGIGGRTRGAGQLFLSCGPETGEFVNGKTKLGLKTWHHVALVRDQKRVSVFLDGNSEPELSCEADAHARRRSLELFIGGSSDRSFTFEGKIDEVVVFDRALPAPEIAGHVRTAHQEAHAQRPLRGEVDHEFRESRKSRQ